MPFRQDIVDRWYSNVQISRAEIFGDADDSSRPTDPTDNAETMFAGYVGKDYVPGDCLLLAINPGGGGVAMQSRADDEFYGLLKAFKQGDESERKRLFEAINTAFIEIVKSWTVWRVIAPTIEAAGRRLNHIAYLNAVSYRTKDNKLPPTVAREKAWNKVIEPSLSVLKPGRIIAIGKTVHDRVLERFYEGDAKTYFVPRVRGDRAIHKDAHNTFEQLRSERADSETSISIF